MVIDWGLGIENLPILLRGAKITIQFTVVSVFLGSILGLFFALGRMSRIPILKYFCVGYIDFFRGTPLLVQILLIYVGVPHLFGFTMPDNYQYIAGYIALSLNCAAYTAEIFRSGIQSIDPGQMEAARSLGMTQYQAMRYIILPQAFKVVVPPLGNEFIAMLKDSSLLAFIAIEDLLYSGKIIVGRTFQPMPIYLTVALIYLFMTMALSLLVNYTERRLGKSD
ncbi:MAG TPA: amino acid ABC transporter permease [Peptococcaceae bacterium]|nr:amino acid ABC transporter permease [Peptococcaceae bacterium]